MNKRTAIALVGGSFVMGILTGVTARQIWSRRYCGDCELHDIFFDSDYEQLKRRQRYERVCKKCKGCTKEMCPCFKKCEGCEKEESVCTRCAADFCDDCHEGRTPEEIQQSGTKDKITKETEDL